MWIQFVNSCAFKMKNHRIFDKIIYKNQNGTHFDHHSFTINPNNIQTWNNQHTNGKLYIFVVRQLFCLQLNQLAWIDERKVRYCSKVHLAWNYFYYGTFNSNWLNCGRDMMIFHSNHCCSFFYSFSSVSVHFHFNRSVGSFVWFSILWLKI